MRFVSKPAVALLVCAVCSGLAGAASSDAVDLSQAALVVPKGEPVVEKAAALLKDEVERRTGLELKTAQSAPASGTAIILGTVDALPAGVTLPDGLEVPDKDDGYALVMSGNTLYLIGHDPRGTVFAAGRVIRVANLSEGVFAVPGDTRIATAPKYPMRGHQIGYRATANSYDAWDLPTYEQYVRDCIIFGGNSVELIPNLSADSEESPVMPKGQDAMNIDLARMLDTYDIDVWMWMALRGDVAKPEEYQAELESRDKFFAAFPEVDHVMVPGGDPGDTAPEVLLPWLGDMAKVLQRHHPGAGLWVSNQGFEHELNDTFFTYLKENQPEFLAGVVFGPWTKIDPREERERTPERYAIRRYPDITHNVRCQYPMPEWDRAFAQTLGREAANPRPGGTAHIHNLWAPYADGFVSYSDGCHDDLNKMIWSELAWNPDAKVEDIVRDYAKVFFGDAYADDGAKGLWMLESNWVGSALENEGIDQTLKLWQSLEQRGGDELAGNWRFQLYLLRAYCDAYLRTRLIAETAHEEAVYKALASGDEKAARAILENPPRVRHDLRHRIEELALAMNKSIGMQYSIYEPYRASNTERGAILDGIDNPLNNRQWIAEQLDLLNAHTGESYKKAAIKNMINWENPKPGTLYDDLGCAWKQPHLVRQTSFETDPGFVHGPQEEHSGGQERDRRAFCNARLSWLDQAQTLFGTPLKMHYEDLDPKATYALQVTYTGRYRATMRLVADGQHEVHGPVKQPERVWPVRYELPRNLTQDGVLDLEWQLVEGRGCQVAEVWLIPQ